MEGAGIEMIQLIRMAFSVLNRLLMLRPADMPPSPVEHSLSAQPANRSNRHVVATISQYIYHRHDPRLPVLATLLLKRLAMVRRFLYQQKIYFSVNPNTQTIAHTYFGISGISYVNFIMPGSRS